MKTKRSPKPNRARRKHAETQIALGKLQAPRFQRLAHDIASANRETSHSEFESLLEFVVDGESRGENLQTVYPEVWKHLQNCKRCQLSYELMTTIPRLETPLARIQSKSEPAPQVDQNSVWTKHVRSRVGGAPLGFGFAIQPAFLTRLVTPQNALLTRGSALEGKRLLLSDSITLGDRNIAVTIWLHPEDPNNTARLEILVASYAPLPEPLNAILKWNGHVRSIPVHEGECSFDHIPLTEIADASDLRVDFEEA